jgi:hypothetical protein
MRVTKETARIHAANVIDSVQDVPTELIFSIDVPTSVQEFMP